MSKSLILAILLKGLAGVVYGQGKFLTNEGEVVFYSHTVLEDITAKNEEVASVLDTETGEIAVIVRILDFQFERKLMQEHFNENYMESEKYPKATFQGYIRNNREVDYRRPGRYPVKLEGNMTIHGVSREIQLDGSLEVQQGALLARAEFLINPEDYGIKIPRVVRKNIANNLEVRIQLLHKPL